MTNRGNHHSGSEDSGASPKQQPDDAVVEELRLSQKTLQSIFRAAPTGIGLVQNRVFLNVNERLCTMLGYTEGSC